MFSFENIHKNKTLAFVDGLLCGITIAYFATAIYKEVKADREFKKLLNEAESTSTSN
jgi:capsular polysaccharide biosynthesis protein